VTPSREIHAPRTQARQRIDTKPWYRQFWPWFVISLPVVSVAFSVATLVVAVRNADSLVRDDWYEAGVAINRDFGKERRAAELGLVASIRIADDGRIVVQLDGAREAAAAALRLQMSCPSSAARDQILDLAVLPSGEFASTTRVEKPEGTWDVALTPAEPPAGSLPDSSWRIAGRIDLARGAAARVVASR